MTAARFVDPGMFRSEVCRQACETAKPKNRWCVYSTNNNNNIHLPMLSFAVSHCARRFYLWSRFLTYSPRTLEGVRNCEFASDSPCPTPWAVQCSPRLSEQQFRGEAIK